MAGPAVSFLQRSTCQVRTCRLQAFCPRLFCFAVLGLFQALLLPGEDAVGGSAS